MKADANDPKQAHVWFRLFVAAVAGIQAGDKAPATAYLKFTEKHRGRPVADRAKVTLGRCARSPKWREAWKIVT